MAGQGRPRVQLVLRLRGGGDDDPMDQEDIRVKRQGTEDFCNIHARGPASQLPSLEEVLEILQMAKRWGKGTLVEWKNGREVRLVGLSRQLGPGEYIFKAWQATCPGHPGPSATKTRVRGPQELSDFWLALPQAEISHAGKVLSLVDGMSFLGDRCLGKKLYIRECYEGLERELKELFARKDDSGRKEINAVAIIGDPGIGKSLFGYLLLYRWACERRRVVVVKQFVVQKPTLLTAEGAFELDHAALRDVLSDPEVRYLVDSLNPGEQGPLPSKAQMVLLTSPDADIYEEVWKRNGYIRRYLDSWSWDEMRKCHQSIFPQQPIGEVQARYDRWGGIPRYVFEKLDKADQA